MSLTSTMSPLCKFLFPFTHFWGKEIATIYSFFHLDKYCSKRNCTLRYVCLEMLFKISFVYDFFMLWKLKLVTNLGMLGFAFFLPSLSCLIGLFCLMGAITIHFFLMLLVWSVTRKWRSSRKEGILAELPLLLFVCPKHSLVKPKSLCLASGPQWRHRRLWMACVIFFFFHLLQVCLSDKP